jgi:hypothetical protein
MRTFGRGVRAEYKRFYDQQVPGGSPLTALSVPSQANYFIFINKVHFSGIVSLGVNNPSGTTYNGGINVGQTFRIDTSGYPGSGAKFVDFLHGVTTYSYISGAPDIDPDESFPFGYRIIQPGGYIRYIGTGLGSGTGSLLVYYQEIYFGGQHNY